MHHGLRGCRGLPALVFATATTSCGGQATDARLCVATAAYVSRCLGITPSRVPEQCDQTAVRQVLAAPCAALVADADAESPWWCGRFTGWLPGCPLASASTDPLFEAPELDQSGEDGALETGQSETAIDTSAPPGNSRFRQAALPVTGIALRAVWSDESEIWIVGDEGTAHHSRDHAQSWEIRPLRFDGEEFRGSLRAITVVGNKVFLAGVGVVFDIDGTATRHTRSSTWDIRSTWVTDRREGYAHWGIVVGTGAASHALFWSNDGGASTASNPNANALPGPLHGVWGADADDIWAVGPGGKLLNVAAAAAASVSLLADYSGQVNEDLNAVAGSSSDSIWAVGDSCLRSLDRRCRSHAAAPELPVARPLIH